MTRWRPCLSCSYYEASDQGEIRRRAAFNKGQPGKPLAPWMDSSGYHKSTLWVDGKTKSFWTHRLICEAFHGPPPSPRLDAAHRDGFKANNRPSNLRWATRAENEQDKVAHGRSNRGERNGRAKLTESDVVEIRAAVSRLPRSSGGKRIRKGAIQTVAARYGISKSRVSAIATGRAWRHL